MPAKKTPLQDYPVLQPGETSFQILFYQHPIPMWIFNVETLAFLEVNDAAVEKYGYSPAEFKQMTIRDICPAGDIPQLLQQMAMAKPASKQRSNWRQQEHQWCHLLKDGSIIQVSAVACPLQYKDQPAVLVTVRDITEQENAAEKLTVERQRLRALIDHLPDLLYLKDTDSRFLVANQACAEFMGAASPTELIGKTDADFYPPEMAAQFLAQEQRVIRQGEPLNLPEKARSDANNQAHWLSTLKMPLQDKQGQITGLVGIERNITATRQAQEELHHSEAKLNAVFENLPVGVSILGRTREIIYANPALAQITGMSSQGFAEGHHLLRRYLRPDGSEMPPEELPSARVLAEKNHVKNVEVGIETKPGEVIWTLVNAVSLPFADWPVLLTVNNITARKQAELALNRRLALETVVSFISASLVNLPTDPTRFNEIVVQVLSQLGLFFKAERAALLAYSAAEAAMVPMHEWHAEGFSVAPGTRQQISINNMPWMKEVMRSRRPMPVANVAQLPPAEREAARALGFTSLVLVPLLVQEQITGMLYLATLERVQDWSDIELNVLETVGQIIAGAIERRQNMIDLQESQARFQQIAENIQDVFYLVDTAAGRQLYVSPAFERVWGRSQNTLLDSPLSFLEVIHPDDRPPVEAALARQQLGEATEMEYRVLHPDGTERWVRDRAFPVCNTNGHVERVSGLVADITTYKNLLAEQEQSNRRLRTLRAIDHAMLNSDSTNELPVAVALRHLHALVPCRESIVYTFDHEQNQATAVAHSVEGKLQTTAEPPQPLGSLPLADLQAGQIQQVTLTPDNLESALDRHRFEQGTRAVLKLPLRSGNKLLGKLTLLAGDPDFFTPQHREIAAEVASQIAIALYQARLSAEIQQHTTSLERLVEERAAEIKHANRRLELATRAGNVGIWEWHIPTDRLHWDEQMYQFYGISPTDYLTRARWQQMLHPDDADRITINLNAVTSNEQTFENEFRIIQPIGTTRHIRSVGRVLCDASGQPERVLGISMDVTSQRQAEKTLRRNRDQLSAANAELARLVRLKDEFLASMSHELRTPLNAILGLAEVLQADVYGPLNQPQAKAIGVMEESGRHLLALINDILDISKMEAGKLKLDVASVYIDSLCQSSLRLIKEMAHKKQLKLSTSIDDRVEVICGDERRLKQVLVNLLSNAVKFTPSAGTIGLSVEGVPDQEMVQFTVWDTGIGIDPADIERLFQPFVQVDSRLSREESGTGLGLVLVQRIAELHGGGVTLTSDVGQGSQFTVSLPWLPQNGTQPELPAPAQTDVDTLFPSIRQVLLVEDHPMDSEKIIDYLTGWDIAVTSLHLGEQVIAYVEQSRPDAILLDLHLPGMSGWAVLAELKSRPGTQDIPVVIISATDEMAQGLALGAAAYLVKPFRQEELQTALVHTANQATLARSAVIAPDAPLILLAEDNENNILTLSDFLVTKGYRLVVGRNGLEAVMLAVEEQPDLILMDIQMPGIDGLEAMRRIRAKKSLANVPIIAVTALTMPGDRERCLAAGANEYVSKPIRIKNLYELMTSLLN